MLSKRALYLFLAVCVVVSGGIAIWGYDRVRAAVAMKRAQECLRLGNTTEAIINARLSLETRESPAALQVMADALERAGSALSIEFRQDAARSSPRDPEVWMALATTAIRFDRPNLAIEAMEKVPDARRNTPEFLQLQAITSAGLGRIEDATARYAEIANRFPGSSFARTAQLNLSKFWLASQAPGAPAEAAARLEELADDPEMGLDAKRLIVRRSIAQQDFFAAFRWSTELAKAPQSSFGDKLQLLDFAEGMQSPLRYSAMASLEREIGGDPAKVAQVGKWLIETKGPRAALDWLNRFPGALLLARPVPIVMADARARLEDWKGLEKDLVGQQWGVFEADRYALLFSALSNLKNSDAAKAAWRAAMANARRRPGALGELGRMALAENRFEDAMDAFWAIPVTDPEYNAAQKRLFIYYRQTKNAGGMLRLFERTKLERPDDQAVNVTLATLLLVRGQQPARALQFAGEAWKADPQSVRKLAVYAYALYATNPSGESAAEAVKLLEQRAPEVKATDEALVFYGLLLSACERHEEARQCFQKMSRTQLFPEMLEKVYAAEGGSAASGGGGN